MKILESIKNTIDKLTPMQVASSSTFSRLDPDKLKTHLRLRERAESRGEQNSPLENSDGLDDIEQEIVATIENEKDKASTILHSYNHSYENRINSMKGLGYKGTFEGIVNAAESNLSKHLHQEKNLLDHAKLAVREAENDLDKFKERNGLDRLAKYPKSRFLCYSIALLLVVIETAASGHFFAKGSEFGMIGGYLTAFIPSLLNVLIGWFFGEFALRLAINKDSFKRFTGIALSIILPIILIVLNLLATHYRTVVSIMVDNAAIIALENFQNSPFSLIDVESWMLFLCGIFSATIATIDFWKMDDPYHGYGDIDRNYKEKVKTYEDNRLHFLKELEEIRDERLTDLSTELAKINNRYGELQSIISAKNRIKVLYSSHLEHLENNANILLKYYRNSNISKRNTNPPKYFNKQWKIDKSLSLEDTINLDSLLQVFRQESNEAQPKYAECVDRINKKYSETFVSW